MGRIHQTNKYLLVINYVPGTEERAGDKIKSAQDQIRYYMKMLSTRLSS